MNSPVWQGAYYFGIAVVLAAGVAFGPVGGWVAASLVIGGYVWLLVVGLRNIDDWYERLDRDAR